MTELQLAAQAVSRFREAGKVVVASSGFFNPAHRGHLRYLEAARDLGDVHVVIVNTDMQVGLKGSVPFMPQDERLEIVRGFRCVDFAVLAVDADRSVSETLSVLQPDVFANGGDVRTEYDCREMAICRKYGIRMEFGVGGSEKIQSSSDLIRRAGGGR